MGVLDRFEQRLESLVNGTFARAFKAEVQPVEVAAALQRELDDRAAVVSGGRTVVPNAFSIDLSSHDFERLMAHRGPMATELSELVRTYSDEQGYSLTGPVEVGFSADAELETGIFRVRSETRAAVMPSPSPLAAAAGAMAASARPMPPVATTGAPEAWAKPPAAALPRARLVVRGTAYPLNQLTTVLGRGTDVDIRIDDPAVSRRHIEVVLSDPPVARDLNSTNGSVVDGQRITEVPLHDGSVILLGTTELTFRNG